MPPGTLLLDLAGVARLASVQRPVVSMWRSRLRDSADPFPAPVATKAGRPHFDAGDVAHWLTRTEHGNNPDAVADAAAAAAPVDFDLADPSHVATIDALLTLLHLTPYSLADPDTDDDALRDLARRLDPDDAYLLSELRALRPGWAAWATVLADAAYSPLAASRLLESRHAATRAADGSAGPLAPAAVALVESLVAALGLGQETDLAVGPGVAPTLALTLAERLDAELVLPEAATGRATHRRLLLEGLGTRARARSGAALTLWRLPAPGTTSASEILRAIDDLVLETNDDDRALVIGPARVLTGDLSGDDALTRADVLRSGRVRAIVNLGPGLVVSAPREPLALWVLGPGMAGVPVAERFTAVADLSDVKLSPAARGDVVSDVLAAMGSLAEVRAHAFRFARLVRTASLVAAPRGLMPGRPAPRHLNSEASDLPALLDQVRSRVADDLPLAAPVPGEPGRAPVPAPATVAALVADRHLRVLPGTRVAAEEYADAGLVVVNSNDLDHPATIGQRRTDPLEFARRHASARLTEPGDVVFRTAGTPRAWVDEQGSKVVAHPARILRINAADPGGLVPAVVALDINRLNQAATGPGAWRRWLLRRIPHESAGPLSAALADLAARRTALAEQLAALEEYGELLATAVAAGAVTIPPPRTKESHG